MYARASLPASKLTLKSETLLTLHGNAIMPPVMWIKPRLLTVLQTLTDNEQLAGHFSLSINPKSQATSVIVDARPNVS